MISRIHIVLRTSILTLLLCAGGCTSTPAAAKSVQDADTPKIIAIGDLHGDYKAYRSLLEQAGLTDAIGKWAGGDSIFIQVGDVADRGPDSRKIIEHLQKLQKQARKKGGKVIALIGNHEAMNMTRDLRYVHAGEYAAFRTKKSHNTRARIYKANQQAIEAFYQQNDPAMGSDQIRAIWEDANPLGKLEHQSEWSPKGDIGEWISKNPAVFILEDILFVHGGVSAKYTDMSVDQMNAMTAQALKAQDEDATNIINDEWGPLWYRGLIPGRSRPECEPAVIDCGIAVTPAQELDQVLAHFGANRMVVGHTPTLQGVKSSYGGKLLQIDTGISTFYGGTRSYLRIENGEIYAHDNGVVRELESQLP